MPDQSGFSSDPSTSDGTSLVGRRQEMSDIRQLLPRTRLLTLTGAGGVGKTRMAMWAASALRHAFPDGVEFVDLATLEDGDLLEPTVAAALGLRDTDRPATAVLTERLSDTRMLLVLDNCEHLLQPCAGLVDRLLRAAPHLRVMATSRHRFGLDGEHVLAISSLPVADPDAPPARIARSDAVRLFAERAARVAPGFTVGPGNARTIARIARRLDGIPLALELAAARLRATPPDRLLRELDDRFAVLNDDRGTGTALPRHQTLRATMEWSHALCSPAEQRLWARLSLFPAGAELETAEEICTDGAITRPDVVDLITALVDKSVLNVEHTGTGTRYRMLDSIRAYGREHLSAAEERELLERYCAHHRTLAERHRIDQLAADQLERFLRLRMELPNIRVALESCYARPASAPSGLEIAASLWGFWLLAGVLTEGRLWLERGLEIVPETEPIRISALCADALLALYQGDLSAAAPRLRESHALARKASREEALAFAMTAAGVAALCVGDQHRGLALMNDARERMREAGDIDAVGLNLYLAATFCVAQDPEAGAALGQELVELCETRNAPLFRAYAQFAIGVAAWKQGDWRRSEAMLRDVVKPWSAINDRWGLAQFLEVLAWTAGARGDHRRAARLLGAADTVWREIDFSPSRLPYQMHSHDRCDESARQDLGSRAFGAAFRSGAALGLDRAVAYALEGIAQPIGIGESGD